MTAFFKICAMVLLSALSACGGSAEVNTEVTPSVQTDVPINPLPLNERN
jgi:hypothetical protein